MLRSRGFGATSITPDVASGSGNISGSSSATKSSVLWGATGATTFAGRLVFATAVWVGVSTTISSVTDTDGNAWTVVQAGTNNGSAVGCGIAWCIPLVNIPRNSAAYTITFNLSAAVTTFNWQRTEYAINGPVEVTVTAHGTATGNSTSVAITSANTPNVAGSRTGGIFVAGWDNSARAGTIGGSFTERYDGATGTGRFYGGERRDLAPNTAVAPAATIATSAQLWAACSATFCHTRQVNRTRSRANRPAISAASRY